MSTIRVGDLVAANSNTDATVWTVTKVERFTATLGFRDSHGLHVQTADTSLLQPASPAQRMQHALENFT